MKVMIELETNDIKKILSFVGEYVVENEGVIEKLETLVNELKGSVDKVKEADDEILKQIKDFVDGKPFRGIMHALDVVSQINNIIKEKEYATVWDLVEIMDGRATADDLEASYEALNSYGWRRCIGSGDIVVKMGEFIIDPDTIVRLD